MQAIVQVICSKGTSLREAIVNDDSRLGTFELKVSRKLKPDRPKGWATIHSTRSDQTVGAPLNVQWDSHAHILLCRVVNKQKGPELILWDFVAYLLHRHRRRITVINVVPPKQVL